MRRQAADRHDRHEAKRCKGGLLAACQQKRSDAEAASAAEAAACCADEELLALRQEQLRVSDDAWVAAEIASAQAEVRMVCFSARPAACAKEVDLLTCKLGLAEMFMYGASHECARLHTWLLTACTELKNSGLIPLLGRRTQGCTTWSSLRALRT
eukprot:351335-Chlamydomonas_euryale.AAC.3